jgi:transcriptional regulator with XRE-family HTH domain
MPVQTTDRLERTAENLAYDLVGHAVPQEVAMARARPPLDERTITKETGARLAAARKARGITQIDLSAQLGITQSMLSKYERGGLRLHGALIVRIAELLAMSTDELLGVKVVAPPPIQTLKDRRLRRRIQQIDRLSKRDREALVRTIDAFLARAS